MPRYHFASINGKYEFDDEGTELPNDRVAQNLAAEFAAEVLKSDPKLLWDNGQWRIEVTDEDGVLLFSVVTLAIDAMKKNSVVYV